MARLQCIFAPVVENDDMTAILISDVTVKDEVAFRTYRTRAAASIAAHGGRYLARGGAIDVLEGAWSPRVLIVVEFPTLDQARAWYASSDYAAALKGRDAALSRNLVLVDGISPVA